MGGMCYSVPGPPVFLRVYIVFSSVYLRFFHLCLFQPFPALALAVSNPMLSAVFFCRSGSRAGLPPSVKAAMKPKVKYRRRFTVVTPQSSVCSTDQRSHGIHQSTTCLLCHDPAVFLIDGNPEIDPQFFSFYADG